MFDEFRVNKKGTRLSVAPSDMFDKWKYNITPAMHGIFGVFFGSWMDSDKNTPLREARKKELIAQGMTSKDAQAQATQEIKHKVYGWGVQKQIDPFDSFYVGYVFYSKNNTHAIQIVDDSAEHLYCVKFNVETKAYESFFMATAIDLALHLKTGNTNNLVPASPMIMRECELKYAINADIAKVNIEQQQALEF